MKDRTRTIFRIASVTYLAALAILCFGKFPPSDDIPSSILGIEVDKLVHCLMFLPFVPLAVLSLPVPRMRCGKAVLLSAAALLGLAVAGGIEIFQGFTDYRSRDILDFAADCVGLAAGFAAGIIITIKTGKR